MHQDKINGLCPDCGSRGLSVDNATIKCMISVSLHRVENVKHRFCADADCDPVYFAEDDSQRFLTGDLRERVYQKESDAEDVLVCDCFLHTLGAIHTGQRTVIEDVKDGIQQGHCACDWHNPQGTCCLGNILRIGQIDK